MLSSCLTNSLGRKHELLGCIVFINSICIARTSMLLFKLFKQIKTRIHMIHGYFFLNTRYILLNGVSGCNVEPCTFFPTTKRHKCLIPSDTYWSTIFI